MKATGLLGLLMIGSLTLAACAQAVPTAAQPTAAQPTATQPPAAQSTAIQPTATNPLYVSEAAVPAPAIPAATQVALPDLGGRKVTIAVEDAYQPFNYIDPLTNKAGGWDYEVWGEICVMLHCQPVFVETSWDVMIQSVANGQNDTAADGITITDDRKKTVDFSIGYMAIQERLLVRKNDNVINSIDDMVKDKTLKLGTQTGTTGAETAAKYLPGSQIVAFEQVPFAIQALISGDVNAVIIDQVAGLGYLGTNADAVKLVGPAMSDDELGFIYAKGSSLRVPVDDALGVLLADGYIKTVTTKYFGN